MFFTSDNHFFHTRIKEFCPKTRLGDTVQEMNELMIKAYNDRVGYSDVAYFLGDFSFGQAKETKDILSRLNGEKHLILGNHDKVIRGDMSIQRMFASVQEYKEVVVSKTRFCLFHYPIAEHNQCHRGSVNLHGHTHGNYQSEYKVLDVGIDNRPQADMAPWYVDEILQVMSTRKTKTHDK